MNSHAVPPGVKNRASSTPAEKQPPGIGTNSRILSKCVKRKNGPHVLYNLYFLPHFLLTFPHASCVEHQNKKKNLHSKLYKITTRH